MTIPMPGRIVIQEEMTADRLGAHLGAGAYRRMSEVMAYSDGFTTALQLVRLVPEYAMALIDEWLAANPNSGDGDPVALARALAERFPVGRQEATG